MRRKIDLKVVFSVSAFLFLLIFLVYPVFKVISKSVPVDGPLLGYYIKILTGSVGRRSLLNTLYVAVITTILSTVLGVLIAWLFECTDLPFKHFINLLVMIPYYTPAYLAVVSWIQLIGRSGYINSWLMRGFNLQSPPIDLYTLEGIIAVMTIHLFPLVFLTTSNALRLIDPSLEEAAVLSGAPRYQAVIRITLPLITPSILSGSVMVFLHNVNSFGVPAAIGLPTGKYLLTTRIFAALNMYDVRLACALSVTSIVISISLLLLQNSLIQDRNYTGINTGSRTPKKTLLGKWRYPIALSLILFLSTAIVLPLVSIFLFSLLKAWGVAPSIENLTFNNYLKVFTDKTSLRALTNTLLYGLVSSISAVTLGLIIAYSSNWTKGVTKKLFEILGTIPMAIPGPVIACAYTLAWIKPPIKLYNTPWIIILAYITSFTPLAVRNITGTLREIDPSLEEAGWVSGGSWLITVRTVIIPLLSPGIWSGGILIFLNTIREIPRSNMLYTQGTETLGYLLFSLQSESGGLEVTSAIAVIVLFVIVTGQFLVEHIRRQRK
jgi:iron(III) transport system permease protein